VEPKSELPSVEDEGESEEKTESELPSVEDEGESEEETESELPSVEPKSEFSNSRFRSPSLAGPSASTVSFFAPWRSFLV
jgi:hypothetical protein